MSNELVLTHSTSAEESDPSPILLVKAVELMAAPAGTRPPHDTTRTHHSSAIFKPTCIMQNKSYKFKENFKVGIWRLKNQTINSWVAKVLAVFCLLFISMNYQFS